MPAVTVGTTPVRIADGKPFSRRNIGIQNLGSAPIYFGRHDDVTTSNGIQIAAGGYLEFLGTRAHVGDIYLVSGTPGQDVRWEVTG